MTEPLGTTIAGFLSNRSTRERRLLAACGVVTTMWFAYVAVWQPLAIARDAAIRDAGTYERGLMAVQARPVILGAATPVDDRPLNAIVTEAAAGFELNIRRLEPEGDRLRVMLDDAAFQSLVLWLDALKRQSGLRIAAMDLTRRPAPGTVSATLVLSR